jgi:predicted DNA binding CopG/RHH family protein
MPRMTKEEREVLEAFERGTLKRPRNRSVQLKKHREYAAETFRKDQRVNVRISGRDLDALRKRALREGIPYQTLIASVLHKYVEGQLKPDEPVMAEHK